MQEQGQMQRIQGYVQLQHLLSQHRERDDTATNSRTNSDPPQDYYEGTSLSLQNRYRHLKYCTVVIPKDSGTEPDAVHDTVKNGSLL